MPSIQPDKTPLLLTESRVTACQQDNRPTGGDQNRSSHIARSARAVGIIDTTLQHRRDFDLSRSAQDTCSVSAGESIQSVAANQYSERSGRRSSRAMPEFDRRERRNRRRNREESERNNRPSPSHRSSRSDWDLPRFVPRSGGILPPACRCSERSDLGSIGGRTVIVAMRVMRVGVEMHGAHVRTSGRGPEKPARPSKAVRPLAAE
jgi:hypothetical protein